MKRTLRIRAAFLAALAVLFLFSGCRGGAEYDYLIGDVNGDGTVDGRDSLLLSRKIGGERDEVCSDNADMTFDGTLTDQDLQVLREYLSGLSRPGSRFSEILLEGVPVSDYSIVISDDASQFEVYTADILKEYFAESCGSSPDIVRGTSENGRREILIGSAAGNGKTELSGVDYELYTDGEDVILRGEYFMVGAGAGQLDLLLEKSAPDWNSSASVSLGKTETALEYKSAPCENIILFIGDGMGKNAVAMATAENPSVTVQDGSTETLAQNTADIFWASLFPNVGEAVTLNYDGTITDSAASGTALATGYKTKNGVLGMIPADLDGDGVSGELRSVQNVREMACLNGKMTAVLSTDRITGATPNAFLVHHSYRYDSDVVLEQQTALDGSSLACNVLWCDYDSDDFVNQIKKAVSSADNGDKGFFIMAEEAMIDKYESKLDYENTVRTVCRLNDAVAYAATYAACHPETAIIVTADHETGGIEKREADGIPVFAFTSGGDHTAAEVPVYAIGGGTEVFGGQTVDNTEICEFMMSVINAA